MNFTRNVLTVICENMVILYGFLVLRFCTVMHGATSAITANIKLIYGKRHVDISKFAV